MFRIKPFEQSNKVPSMRGPVMSLSRRILLVILIVLSSVSLAEAKSTKHKKKKKAVAPVEQTLDSETGQAKPATQIKRDRKQADVDPGTVVPKPGPLPAGPPVELQMKRAS